MEIKYKISSVIENKVEIIIVISFCLNLRYKDDLTQTWWVLNEMKLDTIQA